MQRMFLLKYFLYILHLALTARIRVLPHRCKWAVRGQLSSASIGKGIANWGSVVVVVMEELRFDRLQCQRHRVV